MMGRDILICQIVQKHFMQRHLAKRPQGIGYFSNRLGPRRGSCSPEVSAGIFTYSLVVDR
jgi:hypothetical protein